MVNLSRVVLAAALLAAAFGSVSAQAPAAAGDDAKAPAVPVNADAAALALKLDSLMAQITAQVRALRARAMRGDTAGIEQAQADLEDLHSQLALLLPERPKTSAATPRDRRSQEAQASQALSELRSALTLYSGDHDWQFPNALDDLVPKYIKEIPTLDLPGHGRVTAVRMVAKLKEAPDLAKQLQDSGGWLYVSDVQSPLWGSVLIDCTHKTLGGDEWDRL